MTTHHVFLAGCSLLLAICTACSDDDAPLTIPEYEPTHAQLAGYQGQIHTIEVYNLDDDFMELYADFDKQGHCLQWNVTGMSDAEAPSVHPTVTGSGWMSAPGNYRYTYNSEGQLMTAVRSDFDGETEHFVLTYGAHDCSLPLPFPLGSFSPYMVQGISRIDSENFHLVCDGKTASAERHILSWMSLKEKTEFQIERNQVVEQTTRLYRCTPQEGETQIQRIRTFYEYQGNVLTRMLQVTIDSEDNQEKTESVFDAQHPYRLLCRRFYGGTEVIPLNETFYHYNAAGRLIEVSDPSGNAFFESPFTWEYSESDSYGNWTSSLKTYPEGFLAHLTQTISYW